MQSGDKLQILKLCPAFRSADPATLGLLSEILAVEIFQAGETIFQSGELAASVVIIAEGRVSVYRSENGAPVRTMGPGEIAGEYRLFADAVRTATPKAVGDAVVLTLEYQRFASFQHEYPDALFELMRTAVARLTALERKTAAVDNT